MKKYFYIFVLLFSFCLFTSNVNASNVNFRYAWLKNIDEEKLHVLYDDILTATSSYQYVFCSIDFKSSMYSTTVVCYKFHQLKEVRAGDVGYYFYYSAKISEHNINGNGWYQTFDPDLEYNFNTNVSTYKPFYSNFDNSNNVSLIYVKGIDSNLDSSRFVNIDFESDIIFDLYNDLPSYYLDVPFNNIVYSSTDVDNKFYGVLNRLFDSSEKPIYNYTINYYFNNVIDSSKTVVSSDYVGSSINVINYSDNVYNVDNNNYSYVLDEDNKVINIYYFDSLFGTNNQQISTKNSHLPFLFNMEYIKEIFPSIDFTKFTMSEQFILTILFNILFLLFIFVFCYFLRILFNYVYRLF